MIEELKSYEALRLSGDPWLGEIPKHWSQKRLWSMSSPRVERNPGNLPLLSVFLDRGVIPYGEGGGQVHAPSLDLSNYGAPEPSVGNRRRLAAPGASAAGVRKSSVQAPEIG